MKKILIASDHAGYTLKTHIISYLTNKNYEVFDLGANNSINSVDYPDYGNKLAKAIKEGQADTAIAVCGSGIGISIALNRYNFIRCALCFDEEVAQLARKHNNANVLALGGRFIDQAKAEKILENFLNTEFEGGRHAARVAKL